MDISGISENDATPSAAEQMAAILAQQTTYQFRPAYRFKTPLAVENAEGLTDSTGRKIKRGSTNVRRHVDHFPYCLNYVHHRHHVTTPAKRPYMQPHILYSHEGWIPHDCLDDMEDCIPTKFVRAALNKHKCPIFAISWTPEGKRLITGGSRGEFTLWNGSAFNFETILQAHDQAIRALKWTGDKQWLVSGDGHGYIKYWQQNMNNVHMFQAHEEQPIRCISFSPTDTKFVTSSDDGTAKVWDFYRSHLEQTLTGHGSEVFSAEWHPFKGMIATGSRDTQQPVKLWDPRTGKNLATLFEHKNSVMSVKWNGNGNWLATGSRDHSVKLYDIRMLKEIFTFKAHKKEVSCVAWHPIHTNLLSSGGMDGSLAFWDTRAENDVVFMDNAHDQAIWTMEWHPFGHIFATGANDHNTKFWVRNRPGDLVEDIFGINAKDATNLITGPTILNTTTKKEEVGKEDSQTQTPHVKGATAKGVQAISSFFKANPTVPGICLAKKEGEGDQVGGNQVEVAVQGSVNVPPTSYGKRTLIKQTPTGRPKRVLECDFDFHGSPTMERHVGEVGEGGAYIEGYRIQKQSFLGNGRSLKM